MAINVYVGEKPSIFKNGAGGEKYILTGVSGGVQNDGGESWSITLVMKREDLTALKNELFLGRPLSQVLTGFTLPSKNSNCRITAWNFAFQKGDLIEATINAGIDVNVSISYSPGSRSQEEWSIETVQEEVPIVEVASYWQGIAATNNANNRAKLFSLATALANIEFNGLLPERGAQWNAVAKEVWDSLDGVGIDFSEESFRQHIPTDLLARIQTGNITLKLGALHVSRRWISKTLGELMQVGAINNPISSVLKFPSGMQGEVISDSAIYSFDTGEYNRSTVWKLSRRTDS